MNPLTWMKFAAAGFVTFLLIRLRFKTKEVEKAKTENLECRHDLEATPVETKVKDDDERVAKAKTEYEEAAQALRRNIAGSDGD